MKITVLSDLHVEFDRGHRNRLAACRRKLKKSAKRKTLEATGHPTLGPNFGDLIQFGSDDGITSHTDLVILAGDIDLGPLSADYAGGLSDWLGVPVVLIAGNHEFYGGEYFSTIESLRNRSLRYTGLNFLERDRLDLEYADGPVRVLGCSLWTDFLLFGEDTRVAAMDHAAQRMTDFSGEIQFGDDDDRFLPDHAAAIFAESFDWLQTELARDFRGNTIVVTHHAPAFRSVPQKYRNDLLAAAYASRLEPLIESSGAALWVHGHFHRSSDYRVGATRVICNPRGYRGYEMNKKFKPGLLVDI